MAHSRKRSSKKNCRSLRLESLERRNLLAGDVFHNYLSPGDVNNDNHISAIDALTVINRLNHLENAVGYGEGEPIDSSAFEDVNDDGHTTAVDALMIINQLNLDSSSIASNGQELEARFSGVSGERAKVEIENEHGGLKLEAKIQNALPGESYDVTIGNSVVATLVTNSRGRASLETYLTGAAADTLAAANAGTSVGISGIGASVFGGEQSDDDDHSEDDDNDSHDNDSHDNDSHDNDSHDNDHEDTDGHDDDIDHDPLSDTYSNGSDSDDGLNNSGSSDSSNDSDDSSDDVGSGSSSVESSGNDTGSSNSNSSDDDDHGLDGSSDNDSDDGPGHVNDDTSSDSDSDNDDGPLTPSVPGTTYGEWKARLTGSGLGKAEFEIERGEMEFEVEVQGFAANSTYPVSVGGVVIGQLRTNSRGKGELEFEVGDDDYRPFPANFPTIAAGTSVSVGDRVSGVFAAKLNDHDDDRDD